MSGGHTISMTIDWESGTIGFSVATCACGWSNREDRSKDNCYALQDEAIEKHWKEEALKRGEAWPQK